MKPTLIYGFDVNTLLKAWDCELRTVDIDGIRVALVSSEKLLNEYDIYRQFMPYRDGYSGASIVLKDYWKDKLQNYKTIAEVAERLNIKGLNHLPTEVIRSHNVVESLEALGNPETLFIRPSISMRSIDAFVAQNNEHHAFAWDQFKMCYDILQRAREGHGKTDRKVVEKAFRVIGVQILSDNSFQEFPTHKGNSTLSDHKTFFMQPYTSFLSEYRIIKAAPNRYYGYEYNKAVGWEIDLQQVELKTLDALIGKTKASLVKLMFEDPAFPFCCSIDLGLTEDEMFVHEYSGEFMVSEYKPRDLDLLAKEHLRGIIKHYKENIEKVQEKPIPKKPELGQHPVGDVQIKEFDKFRDGYLVSNSDTLTKILKYDVLYFAMTYTGTVGPQDLEKHGYVSHNVQTLETHGDVGMWEKK